MALVQHNQSAMFWLGATYANYTAGNKHYFEENGLYPDQWLASDDII